MTLGAIATLPTGMSGGAVVVRDAVLPERVPASGLLIVRDGDPGKPEVTLSPLRYHWQHRAEIEMFLRAGPGIDAAFDALAAPIRAAILTVTLHYSSADPLA